MSATPSPAAAMRIPPLRHRLERLLAHADVRVDGDRDWDLHMHDPRLPMRVLAQGSLGLGESYMDGWWDARSLDGLLYHLLDARIDERVRGIAAYLDGLRAQLFNLQTRSRSFTVGERHYDLGNDLYAAMLGKRLVYSCGYWREATTLDDAQEAKLDLVCRKLGLQPGMRAPLRNSGDSSSRPRARTCRSRRRGRTSPRARGSPARVCRSAGLHKACARNPPAPARSSRPRH